MSFRLTDFVAILALGGAGCSCVGEASSFPEGPDANSSQFDADVGSLLVDAGRADTGSADAGSADAGSADAGSADAGSADAGSADAGSADAGSADAGSADAGPADAGPADAGPGTLKFAYVANSSSNDISAYTIDPATGALTQIICGAAVGAPCGATHAANFAAGAYPYSVAIDPAGKFAYVANYLDQFGSAQTGAVSAYTINPNTGALAVVAGSPFAAANWGPVGGVAVDPKGRFAYAVNQGDAVTPGPVSAYTIDRSSGALAHVGTDVLAGPGPDSVAVDPTGRFAYVTNQGGNVSAFTIDSTTGALSTITCVTGCDTYYPYPGYFPAGTAPSSVSVDPTGKFAYLVNINDGTVEAYSIDSTTGALTLIKVADVGESPRSVAVDPTGKFAYVANAGSNDISVYSITATGALSQVICGTAKVSPCSAIHAANFAAGQGPFSVTVESTGRFAYAANRNSNDVSAYAIDSSTGALTPIGSANVAAGTNPVSIATTP